jgi:hypothetical protein
MTITPVDKQYNLFLIEDIYPQDLIDQISQVDYMKYDWELQEGQLDWPRRKLLPHHDSILFELDKHLNTVRFDIADSMNGHFPEYDCWSSFWLDYPPYTCKMHTDGDLPTAMQIYLLDSAEPEHGTVFYNPDETIRYIFPYKVNTGYLMINGPDQYHGVPTVLPEGQLRLSSYTYFGPFTHK